MYSTPFPIYPRQQISRPLALIQNLNAPICQVARPSQLHLEQHEHFFHLPF